MRQWPDHRNVPAGLDGLGWRAAEMLVYVRQFARAVVVRLLASTLTFDEALLPRGSERLK